MEKQIFTIGFFILFVLIPTMVGAGILIRYRKFPVEVVISALFLIIGLGTYYKVAHEPAADVAVARKLPSNYSCDKHSDCAEENCVSWKLSEYVEEKLCKPAGVKSNKPVKPHDLPLGAACNFGPECGSGECAGQPRVCVAQTCNPVCARGYLCEKGKYCIRNRQED